MTDGGWIGVDLDGTLAEYDGWQGEEHIGAPVPAMVDRVRAWVEARQEVRIFTARVAGPDPGRVITVVQQWCREHVGYTLPITNVKDFGMIELWDDRAVTIEQNTGRIICHPHGQVTP